jgi:hypothetical protein
MGLSDSGHDDLAAAERAEPGISYRYLNEYGLRL